MARQTSGQRIGLIVGALLFGLLLCIDAPAGISPEGWIVASMTVLMAAWWFTEALPLGVTALVPLIVLPLAGVSPMGAVANSYASPFAFLLIGGLMIGRSFEKWNLHARTALSILTHFPKKPIHLACGMMLTSAVLSMWMSNTATCIMLTPIALSLGDTLSTNDGLNTRFKTLLLLTVAYGASIGGIATPIGTPTNLVVIGYLESTQGLSISFAEWTAFGLPIALALLAASLICIFLFGPNLNVSDKAETLNMTALPQLGALTSAERRLATVFLIVVLAWLFRRQLNELDVFGTPIFQNLTDPMIAMIGAMLLFVIPSGQTGNRTTPLLDWPTAVQIPWGIILLFGGSISLGVAITETGLANWLSESLSAINLWPFVAIMALIVAFVVFMTEIVGNVATASALVPVVSAVAIGFGTSPEALAFPLAVAASCAFMLPMATGPNAIVHATGSVSMSNMMKIGIALNIVSIITIISFFALFGAIELNRP